MNRIGKFAVGFSIVILGAIALAPLFGIVLDPTIWGIAVGALSSLAGSIIPSAKERFVFEQPSNYKAVIKIESEER